MTNDTGKDRLAACSASRQTAPCVPCSLSAAARNANRVSCLSESHGPESDARCSDQRNTSQPQLPRLPQDGLAMRRARPAAAQRGLSADPMHRKRSSQGQETRGWPISRDARVWYATMLHPRACPGSLRGPMRRDTPAHPERTTAAQSISAATRVVASERRSVCRDAPLRRTRRAEPCPRRTARGAAKSARYGRSTSATTRRRLRSFDPGRERRSPIRAHMRERRIGPRQ